MIYSENNQNFKERQIGFDLVNINLNQIFELMEISFSICARNAI